MAGGASTEETLALIKSKTDNIDVLLSTRTKPADVQAISATALPLPTDAATQTTLALIKAKTDNIDVLLSTRTKPADTQITNALTDAQLRASNIPTTANLGATMYVQSTGNNTNAQLTTNSTFTGAIESALSYPQIIISIRCDQNYTITIDQFSDAAGTIQYSPSIIYYRAANNTFNQAVNICGSYYRIKITNNGVSTTTNLFLETWLGILPPLPNIDNNGNLPIAIERAALIQSTTAATGIALTVTLPAVASQFHNITHLEIAAYSTAARTGSATPIVVTTTNLNSLAFTFATAAAIGTLDKQFLSPTLPVKSAVVNTATTIVCPATTGIIWRINIIYNTSI
jgi:hypothetical protein